MATIRISDELLETLNSKKIFDEDSYEEVIWSLIEYNMELSEETKRRVEKSRKEMAEGKFYTHEQVKKELGL